MTVVAPQLSATADVHAMLMDYGARREGYGLDRMLAWVKESKLPEEVKGRYMRQHATGMIYPEDFR